MELKADMTVKEQVAYLITLGHDEYLEEVIAGYESDYGDWMQFMGQCVVKLMVPRQ